MKKNRVLKILVSVCMCICILFTTVTPAFAWNATASKKAYSYYHKSYVAELQARVWVSQFTVNMSKSKVVFDATSSSWVFNCTKNITNHVNKLTLKKTGLTGTLSVSTSAAGVSVSEKTESLYTMATTASNSYYRGITTYNNTITRGVWGTIFSWWTVTAAFTNLVVTGTSVQTVCIDTQPFSNTATTTAYF